MIRGLHPLRGSVSQPPVIPPIAHFIWFGKRLPWVHAVALRSAARQGGFSRVILHHDSDLSTTDVWPELCALPGFESRRIDSDALFAELGADGVRLQALYAQLSQPAARANVVRAAILAAEGGVYLDTDTVTLASLLPLLSTGAFCGVERVAFPRAVVQGRALVPKLRAYGLTTLREVTRWFPDGYRRFAKIEHLYPVAPNNAVLGAEPRHPFILGLLEAMLSVPPARQTVRYALGTHALERAVTNYRGEGLVVHPPEVFYPMGPEISRHWFRLRPSVDLTTAIRANTRVVHWYASVRTKQLVPCINPEYVERHQRDQLLSALLLPYV